jgi:hypothetical protein
MRTAAAAESVHRCRLCREPQNLRGNGDVMTTTGRAARQTFSLTQDTLLTFVRAMMCENAGPPGGEPHTPGPWDRAVRCALASTVTFGPHPEQWRLASLRFSAEAFYIALARAVTSRAELLDEIADATSLEAERAGTVSADRYVARFVDDFCSAGLRLNYPFHGPRPQWFCTTLGGVDLAALGAEFGEAAKQSSTGGLGEARTQQIQRS